MQSLEECAVLTVVFNIVSYHNRIPKSLLIYIYAIYKYVPHVNSCKLKERVQMTYLCTFVFRIGESDRKLEGDGGQP